MSDYKYKIKAKTVSKFIIVRQQINDLAFISMLKINLCLT